MSRNQDIIGWNRRDSIGAAALLALAVGVPVATIHLSHLEPSESSNEQQVSLLRDVAQLIIPRTATLGAGDAGAGQFVLLAFAHGLEKSREPWLNAGTPSLAGFRRTDGSLRMADWLETELDRRAGGDFMRRNQAMRASILAALNAKAFAEGSAPSIWKVIKRLILTGYYTSEVGGSRELRFELVPGRFDPVLPLEPGDVAFSSDWSAVDFG